jgi:trehalose 6-phosphate synthase
VTRLVVVSNRLPSLSEPERAGEPEIPAGGLVSVLLGAMRATPGSMWFGWSGRTVSEKRSTALARRRVAGIELVGMGLTATEVERYYRGFCNGALWPLLHCFADKVRLDDREVYYRRVQARFAAALRQLLHPGDWVWVHDYHLLLLGRELRRLGWRGRMGFFLHTPFPPHALWQVLPDPSDFLDAMLDYDVVGFHTQGFCDNYVYSCQRELDARWRGGTLHARGRSQHVGVYPAGVDPGDFRMAARGHGRLASELRRAVRGRRILLGVDRLDYTKGIPERILGFRHFLRTHPEWRSHVCFVQIASPSRTSIRQYAEQRARVEALVGRVNGELAEADWVPIRYLYRNFDRDVLARFYREADVALVTPLRDGMNLVAKEYIAAQDPESPGVLVLSRCAGAAEELREAVIVNPYIAADIAAGIARALTMPLEERRQRHLALLTHVRANHSSEWARRFLADLGGAQEEHALPAAGVLAPNLGEPEPGGATPDGSSTRRRPAAARGKARVARRNASKRTHRGAGAAPAGRREKLES